MPSPDPARLDLEHLSCEQLVERLELQPHPEGGWYREVLRRRVRVFRADGASRWHRVRGADETWQFIAGAALEAPMMTIQNPR